MLNPGTILDNKYRIEGVIGRGGFGHVYRARERLTGEIVAIKELVPSFVDDREMVQRFIQEARATLRLTHTHIARTYTIFEDRGTYYLAMEYLPGGSLADRLGRGPLPLEEAVRIAGDLCRALAYAHRRGVVHCDIKPANVLFDEDGGVRLADFGIAHVSAELMTRQFFTATGTAMGTVRYMAPEQLEGVRDDPRVDLYAVGAMLYEMVAGRPYLDFETESTPLAQANNIHLIRAEPARPLRAVNPRVPAWLAQVVERALRKAPGERFASAEALREVLQRKPQRQEEPQPTKLVSDREPTPPEDKRRESSSWSPPSEAPPGGRADWLDGIPVWGWALGGLAAIALLVGGGMWLQRVIGPATPPPVTTVPGPTDTLTPTSTATREPTKTSTPTSTPTAEPPAGETWRRPDDDAVMVYVPGGEFEMGSTEGDDDEQPVHTVALDGFWLDQTEVTNAQYALCVADGDCEESGYADDADFNGDNYPVAGVSWHDAKTYCEWARARLPTEAEWEYAAQGERGTVYPWGNEFECSRGNFDDETALDDYVVPGGEGCDGYERTAPVGSFPSGASWCEAQDMAGNVWEWTASLYEAYPYEADDGRNDPQAEGSRVLRGGSWGNYPVHVRCANRRRYLPVDTWLYGGFRCARGSQ